MLILMDSMLYLIAMKMIISEYKISNLGLKSFENKLNHRCILIFTFKKKEKN
jgi:hypothetical protein